LSANIAGILVGTGTGVVQSYIGHASSPGLAAAWSLRGAATPALAGGTCSFFEAQAWCYWVVLLLEGLDASRILALLLPGASCLSQQQPHLVAT